MNPEGILLSEMNPAEKDTYHVISLMYGIKTKINEQTKQKQTHSYREQIAVHHMRRGWGMGEKGEGVKKYKFPVIKIVMGV